MLLYVDVVRLAFALAGVALAAILVLWHKIIDWAQASLFPWIEKNLPLIASDVKEAFTWLDNNVVVPIRRMVKKAWNMLRQYLLKTVIQFERQAASRWTRRVTSFLIEVLTPQSPTVKKVETVEEVDWDNLPDDVRQAWVTKQQQSREMDFTEVRDQEIGTLDMTN